MKMKYDKPTKTGYYWLWNYNPATGMPDYGPEIVTVAFDLNYRNKKVTRVIAKFWQANLEEVNNVKWSDEIIPPSFI